MVDRDEFEASPPTLDEIRGVFEAIGASGIGSAEVDRRLRGRRADGRKVRQWLDGSRAIGFLEWTAVLCIAMQLKVGGGEGNAPTP